MRPLHDIATMPVPPHAGTVRFTHDDYAAMHTQLCRWEPRQIEAVMDHRPQVPTTDIIVWLLAHRQLSLSTITDAEFELLTQMIDAHEQYAARVVAGWGRL